MENTLENKSKFFAQYYYQNILNGKTLKVSIKRQVSKFDYISLKPLSSITDEDKYKVYTYLNLRMNMTTLRYEYESTQDSVIREYTSNTINVNCIDYLRSKGYALPFMGLSVDTLIEYGWVKLKKG